MLGTEAFDRQDAGCMGREVECLQFESLGVLVTMRLLQ